ncbi:MAG: PTS system mannose/fructose/sorbose family transporter subunit IID [Bulleidia sp.]|nr:PTS system mannose/fructose/sorbose family transporter subunit IID [Bulleidia sp.]
MVVGITQYTNKNEAFPLDKKTLNQVALRSFMVSASKNSETGEAYGWCHALAPALKKIHENEEDLALSMGHNLEYVETGSFFSTLAMGVVLSLEAQKCDLETIRSVRTTMNVLCNSLSHALFNLMILSTIAIACIPGANNGNVASVVVFALAAMILTVVLRFVLIKVGYAQGTKIMEKLMKKKEDLAQASKIMGGFTVGGLIVLATKHIGTSNTLVSAVQSSSLSSVASNILNAVPACIGLVCTYVFYYLLTKKNYSITKCVGIVVLIGCIMIAISFVLGMTTSL